MKKKNEYIELLDGTTLSCYPKVEEDIEVKDPSFVMPMLRYFIAGRRCEEGLDRSIPLRELFWDNAAALYDISDRILSDSKMFFVPIPHPTDFQQHGDPRITAFPTLGMYVELWKSCPEAILVGKNGDKMVCYDWLADLRFAGKNGAKCELKRDFAAYVAINKKARELKSHYKGTLQKYQCYSLLQVLAMLEQEGRIVIPEKAHIIYRLTTELAKLENINRQVVKDRTRMRNLFHTHLISEKEQELRIFLAKMKTKKAEVDTQVDDAHNKRVALRIKLREGELTPKRYEGIWKPINRKKKAAIAAYNNFVGETLRTLFPIEHVPLWEIEGYMYENSDKDEPTVFKF